MKGRTIRSQSPLYIHLDKLRITRIGLALEESPHYFRNRKCNLGFTSIHAFTGLLDIVLCKTHKKQMIWTYNFDDYVVEHEFIVDMRIDDVENLLDGFQEFR